MRSISIPKNKAALTLLGGAVFVLFFGLAYSFIDGYLYQCRDDGIITMSAARNLVDYGFVGLNPSGPLVEASSSPMQFFLYAFCYWLTGVSYSAFAWWQTVIATFLLGVLFTRFFIEDPKFTSWFVPLSALGLTFFFPFFLWHGSGMENAVTHVLFVAAVYILYRFVASGRIIHPLCLVVFMATIARIESVFHIAFLLILFSIHWRISFKNNKALLFSFWVFVLWSCFQLARYLYFGDLLPNTAYAQNISMADRIRAFLTLDPGYFLQSVKLAGKIFLKLGGWMILATLPFVFLFGTVNLSKVDRKYVFLALALAVLMTTSTLYPFLFGHTRIDIARTTTQMCLFVFLLLGVLHFNIRLKKAFRPISLGVLLAAIIVLRLTFLQPYYLGWSTKKFEPVKIRFTEFARQNDIHRPTVSNPDLGIMSWSKRFNIIDLGMIGTPALAKLAGQPEMIAAYYIDYALPDIIQIHGSWIRRYCPLIRQPRFQELYKPVVKEGDTAAAVTKRYAETCVKGWPPPVYWVRQDILKGSGTPERRFLDLLQKDLSLENIKAELDRFGTGQATPRYVARTVYRFIPELRDMNIFEAVCGLFKSKTDQALLRSWKDPRAQRLILQSLNGP